MSQELNLNQRIAQHLTQKQLRFVRLLELNAPELDEAVERELEANPALEVADSDIVEDPRDRDTTPRYLRYANNGGADREAVEFAPPDDSESLYDVLDRQIDERELETEVAAVAHYIVRNLDSNGYLRRDFDKMLGDMEIATGNEVSRPVALRAYEVVRSLDPAGVGASDLRDSLLLQLESLPASQVRNDAIAIVNDWFEAYYMRHSHRIVSGLKITPARVEQADALIKSLNPKPGAAYGGNMHTSASVVTPDFVVGSEDGRLHVSLNNRIPELALSDSFSEAMRGVERRRGRPKKGTEFVANRYNDARDFIEVLRQRQRTMFDVMTAIVSLQKEYFETGDVFTLRPMMIKDISAVTGLDASVVSRSTTNKYVEMPWGAVVPVRTFFSDSVGGGATPAKAETGDNERGCETPGVMTNRKIEALIKAMVDAEDKKHPLSDEKLRERLLEQGYDISRRTIAKYRDRQGILVARLRRKL